MTGAETQIATRKQEGAAIFHLGLDAR